MRVQVPCCGTGFIKPDDGTVEAFCPYCGGDAVFLSNDGGHTFNVGRDGLERFLRLRTRAERAERDGALRFIKDNIEEWREDDRIAPGLYREIRAALEGSEKQ